MRTLGTTFPYSSLFSRLRKKPNIARCVLLFSIFYCFSLGRVAALAPARHITQYGHSAWRIQDGFFSGAPNAIAQTSDGYLWIGTQNGLVRFDGVRFVPWGPPNGKRLSGGIFSLLAASDGSLWIGTGTNLAHLKDGDLINYEDGLGRINAILEDRNGTVWITRSRVHDATGPLCQVAGTKLRCHGQAEGIKSPYAEPLAIDSDGNLWMGSSDVLTRWRTGSSATYLVSALKSAQGLTGVQALAATPAGSLWIGISRRGAGLGLQQLVQGVWKPFLTPTLSGSTLEVTALFLDRGNSLWIGTTDQGVYRLYDGKVEGFLSRDGLSSDSVTGFYEDREGNLWVATSEGVDCFRNTAVVSFSTREGLRASLVDSVLAGRDGKVWIGNHGALDSLHDGNLTSIQGRNGLPGEEVTSLLEDHAGRLWVGVDNGLSIYEEGRFNPIKRRDGTLIGTIIAISEDRDENIWAEAIGNPARLIRIHDGAVREEIPVPQVPAAVSLAADLQDGIWLGLVNGDLARYRHGQIETFPVNHGQNSMVRQVLVNPDGSVLGATSAGLVGWRDGVLRSLTVQNGLPCDVVYSLVFDSDQALWLYTQCGLIKVANLEMQKWWEHADAVVQIRVFDVFDGARPSAASFEPRVSRDPDGRLWFANGSVLQMVDPAHMEENAVAPRVHINAIVADRKGYSPQGALRLPPLTRDLEIDYTALSFAVPQKVLFRYMLDGRDARWQEPGTRRQAFYNDLRPGHYRFRVIACNNDGVWNETGAFLDFSITPAYYQTGWFRTACAGALLLLVWVLYQLRLQQLHRQFNIGLEARVNERTRIARELHDTLLQSFHGLLLRLQTAAHLLPKRPDDAKTTLDSAIEQASQAIAEGRDAVQGLRSSTVVTNDLAVAIRTVALELAAAESNRTAPSVAVAVEGSPRELHPIVRDEAYRIAAEVLRNAFQHAQAARIEVEIRYDSQQLRLRVRDDGKGMDAHVLSGDGPAGHFGLAGIRERAQLMGGNVEVWSNVGSGTEVELTIPSSAAYDTRGSRNSWLSRKPT
jgi:signal transduction histidine kinase/ligand-binding sensor domain-containing protein